MTLSRLLLLVCLGMPLLLCAACPDGPLSLKAMKKKGDRDFTRALQRAVDTMNACGGGTIQVPIGISGISGPIDFAHTAGIRLAGQGAGSIFRFASDSAWFKVNMAKDLTFDRLAFEFAGGKRGIHAIVSSTSAWGARGIRIADCSFSHCGVLLGSAGDSLGYWGRNATVTGCGFTGYQARILVSHWKGAVLEGNVISAQEYSANPDEHNISGIRCENRSEEILIARNRISGCAQNGIQVYSGTDVIISENISTGNGQSGIGLNSDDPAEQPGRVTVTGNICKGNVYDGIDINVVAWEGQRIIVTANSSNGNKRAGIYAFGAVGMSLMGNTCDSNGNTGIHMNKCRQSIVIGNRTRANNAIRDGDSDLDRNGITLQASRFCTLSGNMSDNGGRGSPQKFGIFLADGTAGNSVTGNMVRDNLEAGVRVGADDSGSVVRENRDGRFEAGKVKSK